MSSRTHILQSSTSENWLQVPGSMYGSHASHLNLKEQSVSPDAGENAGEHEQERRATWISTGFIQVIDVVGIGVLTLGAALYQLGWAIGLPLLIILCPLNLYAGIALSRARALYPSALSYIDMSKLTSGNVWWHRLVKWTFYSYIIMSLGSYLLGAVTNLAGLFEDVLDLCQPVWALITCAIMIPVLQFRSLHGANYLIMVDAVLFTTAVMMPVVYMILNMNNITDEHHQPVTEAVASSLDWVSFFNSVSMMAFSYIGAYIYLEMMAEMKKPEEFPKAFLISGPYQLGMYALVSSVSYGYFGNTNNIGITGNSTGSYPSVMSAIPTSDPLYRVSRLLLFLHMICGYLIKSTILSRNIHIKWKPSTLNERSWRASLHWLTITSGVLAFCYLLANAIPVFNDLVSLLGSLQSPWVGYIFPVVFLWNAKSTKGFGMTTLEKFMFVVCIGFGSILFGAGTAANIVTIAESFSNSGAPFACHPVN